MTDLTALRDTPPSAPAAALRAEQVSQMQAVAGRQCREAFAALFAFFAPRLKSYVLRLGAAEAEAEDLTHDVMVTVWRQAALYDPQQGAVSTWIFRIARNRLIDLKRRRQSSSLDAEDPLLQPQAAEAPEHWAARSQMERQVRAVLSHLPPEQLRLLKAAFYEGLSHSEIARAFNLPIGTVKSRLRLAFARLKGELSAHG